MLMHELREPIDLGSDQLRLLDWTDGKSPILLFSKEKPSASRSNRDALLPPTENEIDLLVYSAQTDRQT